VTKSIFRTVVLLYTLLWNLPAARSQAAPNGVAVTQSADTTVLQMHWTGSARNYRVLIDDSPAFRTPVFSTQVQSNSLSGKAFEMGLAPGTPYYVQVQPGNLQGKFQLQPAQWQDPPALYVRLRNTWKTSMIAWLQSYSGLIWDEGARKWKPDPHWNRQGEIGADVYNLEMPIRAAVVMGLCCRDQELLEISSEFYLTFASRFTTLGEIRSRPGPGDKSLLKGAGPDSTRTFLWEERVGGGAAMVRECVHCNVQFMHPVARLIRVITLLPAEERTPAMLGFVRLYAPLVLHDHLLRLLYVADWNRWDAPNLPHKQVEIWKALQHPGAPPKLSYQYAMLDDDLWVIATAAELLGANANDPALVPMSSQEQVQLLDAVKEGVSLFQHKRFLHSETRDFHGVLVGSASYFDGDLDDHPDSQYSGVTSEAFPDEAAKKSRPNTSWDISHSYRIPVFLRSLYDNRKATGLNFPSYHDLQLVANQYVYKVFQGNFQRPLFNNYFDGSNGWYRVAYHGGQFGYPPAQFCDAHSSNRPCLVAGTVQGWGLIAFANPDLVELEHAIFRLAADPSPSARRFSEQYFWYNNQPYTISNGGQTYPDLLLMLLSDNPYVLPGCAPGDAVK